METCRIILFLCIKVLYGFSTDSLEECLQCKEIVEELENIDDDCDRHGITFVKTQVN